MGLSTSMPLPGLARIAHATDFSPQSHTAFQHALRLAVAARCRLDILHVRDPDAEESWDAFPRVRQTLAEWEMLESAARPEEIETQLGVKVAKIEIKSAAPAQGLSEFLVGHRPDLLVAATHGRTGLSRLLSGSVSQEVVARASVPTLLIGPRTRPFVDPGSGTLRLAGVLMPVADHPARALEALAHLMGPAGLSLEAVDAIAVGLALPDLVAVEGRAVPVRALSGPVAETILEAAAETRCDLIVMPTAGRHGFLDGLRGSTTQQVLPAAPCPVLSLPLRHA
ncbi:MAG: universal stress protein [Hyphomicrobiaceae bacterium]|nr:universal stress protein [Hyphomicrobiaceae bacterium]